MKRGQPMGSIKASKCQHDQEQGTWWVERTNKGITENRATMARPITHCNGELIT